MGSVRFYGAGTQGPLRISGVAEEERVRPCGAGWYLPLCGAGAYSPEGGDARSGRA